MDEQKMDILVIDDSKYSTKLTNKFRNRKNYAAKDPKMVDAYIPGNIRDIFVTEGQKVAEGEELLILEAMKMKNSILAPLAGTVKKIHVKTDQMVMKRQLLVEIS